MNWQKNFQNPDISYWPEVRWWLAEGFHTDQTLIQDIRQIHDSGFGAIEFLAMDEPGADSRLYGWGSEEWVHDSHTVMREATRRHMGISMTSGTNWSNANLTTITPDDKAAAKELDYTSELLSPGASRHGALPRCNITQPHVHQQTLLAVLAMKRDNQTNSTVYLEKDSAILLTSQVKEESLDWTAPNDGEYELFTFWLHGTGQTASPSASISYTINYIDPYGVEAFIDYWNREVLTDEIKQYLKENNRVQIYMDSLELSTYGRGGQFWGYHFLEEFEHRRGYDLTPYLPFVLKESGGFVVDYIYHYSCTDTIFLEKLRNDLYQTMTDLYMDNMLKPMQEWLHSVGMTLRAEISYGLPFEISQPGKYVDGIETESLEFCSQIESFRNLAGPAHLYRRLYSSETGASLMNYMMGLNFYTQIIYTQFAAGVARTVLHGYSSIAGSERSTHWPGHEGMWPVFSERFGSRQPAWQHYRDWTSMLSRYQMLLRQGRPRVDLGILRLDYNFNNLISWGLNNRTEREYYEQKGLRANEGLYWKDMSLQNLGYTYDYFAPQILEEPHIQYQNGMLDPEGAGYRALIVYQEVLPLSAAKKLLALADTGLPILFVNGVNETLRPNDIKRTHRQAAIRTSSLSEKDDLLEDLITRIKSYPQVKEISDQSQTLTALQELKICPRTAFSQSNKRFLTNMRKDDRYIYLFVYHYMYLEQEPAQVTLSVEGTGKPWILNCWTGTAEEILCYESDGATTSFSLTLNPGEACMVILDTSVQETVHPCHITNGTLIRRNGTLAVQSAQTGICEICFSDTSVRRVYTEAPSPLTLDIWNLEVEDWNEGDKKTITEDRGLGIITTEVYYETRKKRIHAGPTALIPWKDIPAIGPSVSGVGYYTSQVSIPANWLTSCRVMLCLGSTNGNTASVTVNDKKAAPVDFNNPQIDITQFLHEGSNTICIEVSSTLNNRLISRDYYQKSGLYTLQINDENAQLPEDSPFRMHTQVQNYGLTGTVRLVPYQVVPIQY